MRNSHHLELHQIGTRTMLAIAPRGVASLDLFVINLDTTSMQFFLADTWEATR